MRLASIFEERGRPRPITARKTGHSWLWGLAPFVSVLLLGCIGFGAKDRPLHGPMTHFLYVPLAVLAVYAVLYRLRGTAGITDGVYLLPLDLVQIAGDRAIVWPLGDLRKVVRNKHSLMLTFRDGSSQELAFDNRAAVREAYDELERAHDQLVKLSHSSDEGAALEADPFHSLRVDDSWQAAVAKPPMTPRIRWLAALVLGVLSSLGFVSLRNNLSQRDADNAVGRWTLATAAAARPSAAPSFEASSIDLSRIATTPDAELTGKERARVDELAADGLTRFERVASTKPEGPAFVRAALERGRITGHRAITVRIDPDGKNEIAWSQKHAGAYFEGRVLHALRRAFGEHFSPAVLRIEEAKDAYADLHVDYTRTPSAVDSADVIAEEFVFKMLLVRGDEQRKGNAKTLATFELTMPKASTLPALRVNTLFPQQTPSPEHLMAARAFDRLYDELYALFFSGPVHVPLPIETLQ